MPPVEPRAAKLTLHLHPGSCDNTAGSASLTAVAPTSMARAQYCSKSLSTSIILPLLRGLKDDVVMAWRSDDLQVSQRGGTTATRCARCHTPFPAS